METKLSPQKQDILDHFYEYTAEDDWLAGIDIYKGNGINSVHEFPNGLIQAKVLGQSAAEVRIRINHEGQCIQWVECTCRKNRTTGINCEHIAAFAIFLERERPALVKSLNTAMPMKPKSPSRTLAKIQKDRSGPINDSHKVLAHSLSHIHSIGFIRGGPNLKVKAEIKRGELSTFELDIDAAGEILRSKQLPEGAAKRPGMESHDFKAMIGGFLQAGEGDRITFVKALLIPLTDRQAEGSFRKIDAVFMARNYQPHGLPESHKEFNNYAALPLKKNMKNIGKLFAFIPDFGYIPLQNSPISETWWSLPLEAELEGDAYAELIKEKFTRFCGAPLLTDPTLGQVSIMDEAGWQQVNVKGVGGDWFDLDPVYGNKSLKITMAEMVRAFRETNRRYLKKGKVLVRIPDLITEFDWKLDETGELVQTDPIQFHRLSAAVGGLDQIAGSKTLLRQLSKKVQFSPEGELPDLSHTRLKLRSYQEEGVRWFWWLYRNNLAGLLADEMGLGKTHQAMACLSGIQREKKNFRFLIISPTTVLEHWYQKIAEYSPELVPVIFHGAARRQATREERFSNRTMITSYGIVLRDIDILSKVTWDAIVIDEAHYIKNNKTATYQAISRLTSPARMCLTGTPLENNIGELKNIFDFLLPGYLGSDEYFREKFTSKLSDTGDRGVELSLQKLIHPFKLRRTKKQVAFDLPDKIEDFLYCNLAQDQADLYRNILQMKAAPLLSQIRDENSKVPTLHVFAVLNLLKQVCDHPALVLEDQESALQKTSGKFEVFKELLAQCLDAGSKVVIFSQYLRMIDIISAHVKSLGVGQVTLTGNTRHRGQTIKTFQENEDCRVFIGSLLAGGIGIDLTAASTVIHYDRWWNASKENQATDRVHRIGQVNKVQVFKLVTKGTLEEKINHLIARKQALFDKFIEKDEELFQKLSREDLIELLT